MLLLVLFLFVAVLDGCAQAGLRGGIGMQGTVEFEGPDGEALFRIEPDGQTVRFEGSGGADLAVLRLQGERLVIEASDGSSRGFVEPPSIQRRGFVVFAPDGEGGLFELRREPDGDLEVFDASGRVIYEAKSRDYGFKVVDADGRVESKIRKRDGKISVRNASGSTFMSTRDAISPAAAATLSMDGLRFEYAAALCVAISYWNSAERGDRPDQPRSNFSSR